MKLSTILSILASGTLVAVYAAPVNMELFSPKARTAPEPDNLFDTRTVPEPDSLFNVGYFKREEARTALSPTVFLM
ncbi:hypothetical protein BT96DRAFT_1012639 [Gymnopus androsaceus JB14]|uniref:Uncharacterized protein n=1 Tax=Gymnopus androsaceus JB14 TaxID=1447944 RepID=A0A6A4IMP5_9AGAR|nr:hypothetical protein BT96DRAFT_1012639 [Gymnopus androsaceus JB14]